MSSLLALLIAVPVSLGTAILLSELAPRWLVRPASFLVELLAAVPSVIYGLWGVFVLIPWLRDHVQPPLQAALGWTPFFKGTPRGYGLMAGGLILAIMILPTISSVSREVMRAVPATLREGALALGPRAGRWCAPRSSRTPAPGRGGDHPRAGPGVGETMAATMVIGNRAEISLSLFAPSYTMASVIANEFTEATGDGHLSALSEIGLLLFVVTVLVNVVARLLVWRSSKVLR
jgi:phosphate transport system permease protein